MLEAIADFWKPVKKPQTMGKAKLSELQLGSVLSFGFMPQVALSGRKLTVTAVNSYQFGADVLTSFVLSQSNDLDVSMIVADAQGEQYLAISRKLSISERIKLFDEKAIEDITTKDDFSKLACKDNVPELKGWLVSNYKREIQGMRGFFHRADFRDGADKVETGEEFQYTLLGSVSNEHAIEIEKYAGGRIDVYATIYRRTNDITDVEMPLSKNPDIRLVSGAESVVADEKIIEPEKNIEPEKEVVKLEEFDLPNLTPTPLEPVIIKEETTEKLQETEENKETINATITTPNNNEENSQMNIASAGEAKSYGANGHDYKEAAVSFGSANKAASVQEFKSMNNVANGMDNESIECDLRVANQIIDEAIRGEMRLSDVVRRIIELPVAHQEAVQIPITLADEDYSLLAIRYGIPASDRNAIKKRIIQDLGDFSGKKKLS